MSKRQVLLNIPFGFQPTPRQYKLLYSRKGIVYTCQFCESYFVANIKGLQNRNSATRNKIGNIKTQCPKCGKQQNVGQPMSDFRRDIKYEID